MTDDKENSSRPWRLIQFKPQGRPPKVKLIELVPESWVTCDKVQHKCRVFYPGPPYNDKTKKRIQDMVENLQEPLDEWPSYAVDLKGSSETYQGGLKKLDDLTRQSHTFTLDENETVPDKQKKLCVLRVRAGEVKLLFE